MRKTTPQFVEDAQKIHGDKFDYSEVEYVNTHTPVRIKCRRCGVVFLQSPANHLVGRGCPRCSKKQTHKRVTQEMFIARARELHGDKYDYSKTDYQDMRSKVLIVCPRHGEFWQRAQSLFVHQGLVLQMIQDKRHLADMTVASGESWIGKLSNSELREIFR